MAEQQITLNPGESKVVSFEATPSEAKTYQVSVNGLTGSFAATEVSAHLAPCVYCKATFTTEAELIAHMNESHPGKPYLVYAYPEVNQVASGTRLSIKMKVFSLACPKEARPHNYAYSVYISGFPSRSPYNEAILYVYAPSPEGFYEGVPYMRVEYLTGTFPEIHHDIPPGTYPLYSRGIHRKDVHDVGWVVTETFWSGVDTGQKIEVI